MSFKVPPELQMGIAIADLANQVAAHDKSPKTRMILKKLDEPVSMSFAHETPIEDVLKYIKSASEGPKDTGIPIYVDPTALEQHLSRRYMGGPEPSEKERRRRLSITLDLEGVPLKTSLRLLLKQLDLAYCVRDGVLIISSPQTIYQELKEAESAQQGERNREEGGDDNE